MEAFFYVIILLTPLCAEIFCLAQNYAEITNNEIITKFRDGPSQSPNQVFKAVWNVPRNNCKTKYGVDLGLESYEILTNAEGTEWNGDAVTIFYNDDLGLYPFLKRASDGEVTKINAGLPQLTNLTQHFEKATKDILTAIPNPEFSGLAVIDWEKWFPQWDFPTSIMEPHRNASVELVRQRHPDWDDDMLQLVAKLEFEQSAKALMEGTLLLGQRLRPHGQWGFYHHPYCHNNVLKTTDTCNKSVMEANNYIPWLFRQTTAVYPSIYLKEQTINISSCVDARISEAWRMVETYGDAKTQIFSYCRFNYTDTKFHFSLNALNATILRSAQQGLSGIVFWGDHNDTRDTESCQQLQSYIKSALGPTVKMTMEAATSCSKQICSGNGRCKGDIVNCKQVQGVSYKSPRFNWISSYLPMRSRPHNAMVGCTCLCFNGWSGDTCNIPQ